jgi:hypothetical protein
MTSLQLREATGLSNAELTCWLNSGLIRPERIGAGGRNQEFDAEQLPRIYVLRGLHEKGVRLSQLARLPLDLSGRFVVFDDAGEGLRTCRDAEAAIRTVVAGKRWCCAVEIPRL